MGFLECAVAPVRCKQADSWAWSFWVIITIEPSDSYLTIIVRPSRRTSQSCTACEIFEQKLSLTVNCQARSI
jgi:hypothetical protein